MKIFSSSILVPSVLVLALASYGAASYGAVSFSAEATPGESGQASAQDAKGGQEGQDGGGEKEGEKAMDDKHEHGGPLHESMEMLQKNLKALRKLMKPETKAEAIATCQKMESSVLVALNHVPKPAKKLEGSAMLKYEVDFKQRMMGVYGTLLDLQLALDEGDSDKVKTLYRSLGAEKKAGHGIYIDQNGK